MTPGVIHKVKFIKATSKVFKNYVDYIDREEASRNYKFKDFSLYNDYMGNPKKSGSLFTEYKDTLNEDDKKYLKEMYSTAQEKGSLMWQDVFSFDNKWLEKYNLYDKKTHVVDEREIRKAVRLSMNDLIERENLSELLWSASIHYNTDNIHVHIASVEYNPSKERGKRKPKTLVNMKSKFANSLTDRNLEREKINTLIRENIIKDRRDYNFLHDTNMKKLVKNIIKNLPKDKRQWNYNYNTMSDAKLYIDELTRYYLVNYKENEFKELNDKLDKEEEFFKEVYGETKKQNYKENKLNDLYTRMGNSALKEIKNYIEIEETDNKLKKSLKSRQPLIDRNNVNKIKNAFKKDLDSIKNQREYEKLKQEIEKTNELNVE